MGIFSKLFSGSRTEAPQYCAAVIVAAGSSSRFGDENKIFANLWDKPVLAHSLLAFEQSPSVNEIIVVAREEDILQAAELCKYHGVTKVTKILCGGATRQKSSLIGLNEVPADAGLVAIHDGARPLVTPELIEDCIAAARGNNAAVPCVPLKDTVKFCEKGEVKGTPDRASLRAVQTPQVFDAALIKGALTAAEKSGAEYTDDCAAAEAFGMRVMVCEGSDENIKITTPADLSVACALMERRCCQ